MRIFIFIFFISFFLIVQGQEAIKYDSTYNFIGDNYRLLLGQTLLVSSDNKFKTGFYNLFWKNKKGRVYKEKDKRTPMEVVAKRKFFVNQIIENNDNPLLEVVDCDNNEILYINYICNNPNYYPFIIEGYIVWRTKNFVGYDYYIPLSKIPEVKMYSVSNIKDEVVMSHYSQWYCDKYYYDDSNISFKERLVLSNKNGSVMDLPVEEIEKYFIKDTDKDFVLNIKQKAESKRLADSLSVVKLKQEKDSILKVLKDIYEGTRYYATQKFVNEFGIFKINDLISIDTLKHAPGLYGNDVRVLISNSELKHEIIMPVVEHSNFITHKTDYYVIYNFDSYFSEKPKKIVLPESIKLGMTDKKVLSIWGKPIDINRTINRYGVKEQWVYPNYVYLYFTDGILTTIQDHR